MQDDNNTLIYQQAVEWFVRMQDGETSAEERLAFTEWLASSPAHKIAYQRASQLWERFDLVKPAYEKYHKSRNINRRSLLLGALLQQQYLSLIYCLIRLFLQIIVPV